jgi:N-acetylglucosamine-6-sulfatase
MVLNNDLAPTIADLAGATPTIVMDGRSLLPLMRGEVTVWRKRCLIEHWFSGSTSQGALAKLDIPSYFAIRSAYSHAAAPSKLYVEYETQEKEYYDLLQDPFELASRHADPSTEPRRQNLAFWLALLKTASGDLARQYEE